MTNYRALDNVAHADIKVDGRLSSQYGDNLNQVRVFITEFEELQRDFPIFFKQDDAGQYYAVTLLGLDAEENLFLDGTEWTAKYIPAVLQRGPFQIGVPKDGDPIIKIDLDSPRLNDETGVPLFKPNGGLSPYLTTVSKVLNKIHVGLTMNAEFFKELVDASLLETVTLELKLNETLTYSVPDIYSINEVAFQALPGPVLEKFHRSGLLSLCQHVLSSRNNISYLIDRKTLKLNASG